MNRLWVRLSLIYAASTLTILALIALFISQTADGSVLATRLPEGLSEADRQLLLEAINSETLRTLWRSLFSAQLISLLAVTIVAGVLTGILASYRMTQPLVTLEEATRRVGKQQLRHRVEVSGSQEMQGLAEAFNAMVSDLEAAEKRRQNLLADVSHELRSPLTVLQGNLRAALDDVQQVDLATIAKLYDQTRQLNHLVNDLHDLAQAEAQRLPLNLTSVDLGALVAQAVAIFEPLAADEGIVLVADVPAVVPLIRGDRARLTQVLQNLITNGLRYARSELRLTLDHDGQSLFVTVADDGSGIAPEHLPHIFDRFYRTDSSRARESGGTGLGLAIVRSIVEAHHGTVTVESEIDAGTTFQITLPLNA